MTNTIKDNRRTRAKAQTYQRVLDAARGLFAAEGGYEAATIRDIAKAAGMSTGAVFANFEDKADLYKAVYGHAPITPEKGRLLLKIVRNLLSIDPCPLDAENLLETMGFFPKEPEA